LGVRVAAEQAVLDFHLFHRAYSATETGRAGPVEMYLVYMDGFANPRPMPGPGMTRAAARAPRLTRSWG
jgi:hypothetical protein